MKKLLVISIVTLCASALTPIEAQIITTIAGNGVAGYSGMGGPAILAELNAPQGMRIDTAGNIYSAESNSNDISYINTSGIITVMAGIPGVAGYTGDGGQATAAELNNPLDLAFDSHGNIYIGDRHNNVIRMVNTSGIISTVAGNGAASFSGDGGPATAAALNQPAGVSVDSSGNLYIADYWNSDIRMVNTNGIISTIAGQHGVYGYNGDGIPATNAELNYPTRIMVTPSGNIYVSDNINSRVRLINTSGTIFTAIGNGVAGYSGDGGSATSAEIDWPSEVVMDGAGNLYLADYENNVIRSVSTRGIISTVAGNGYNAGTGNGGFSGDGGPAISAELWYPGGVAIHGVSDIYIDETANNRIRKVTLLTGTNEIQSNNQNVSVFPNPSSGIFVINMVGTQNFVSGNIEIYNVLGEKVFEETLRGTQGDKVINVSGQPNGIYFYRVLGEDGEMTGEGKLIIQK